MDKLREFGLTLLNLIKSNHGVNLFNVFVIGFIIKIPLLFLFGNLVDITRYTYVGDYLNYGLNPYEEGIGLPIRFYNKYPPMFFEICSAWFFIFGNSVLSLRFFLIICDQISVYFMYLIGKKMREEKVGYLFAMIYQLFPINYIALIDGENDALPLLFCCIAIYLFLCNHNRSAILVLSFGICTKIFPIFLFLGIMIYYFRKKEYIEIIYSVLILGFIFLIVSIPFLLIDPISYINALIVHVSRRSTGVSFGTFFPEFYTKLEINLGFYIFSISYNFIIQICVFIVLILLFLFQDRNKILKKENALYWGLGFFLLLPVIMQRGNVSNWTWGTPLIIIFLFKNPSNKIFENKKSLLFFVLYYLFVIISLIPYNLSIAYNTYQNYIDMVNIEDYIAMELTNMITIFELIKYLAFILWGIYFLKKGQIHSMLFFMFMIIFLDYFVFYSIEPHWDPINKWDTNFLQIISVIYYIFRILCHVWIFSYLFEKPKKEVILLDQSKS